ncbi:MAG: hypothetical protein ABEJ02_04405 [Candidatus Paceibacteria bacterium]
MNDENNKNEEVSEAASQAQDYVLEEKKKKYRNFGHSSSKKAWLWAGVILFITIILAMWIWNLRTRFYDFSRNNGGSLKEITTATTTNDFTKRLQELKNTIEKSQQKQQTEEFADKLSESLSTSTKKTATSTTSSNKIKAATSTSKTKKNNTTTPTTTTTKKSNTTTNQ